MKSKNILILSNNDNAENFAQRLKKRHCEVEIYNDPISVKQKNFDKFDLVVSYNYSYIVKKEEIDCLKNKLINLHISYLPWNKGADPNIWSFIEDTPKGVTIHRLEEGLDTGKIIEQRQMFFDEETETLFSSYQKLQEAIFELFEENIDKLVTGMYQLKPQSGCGSYHKKADLKVLLGERQLDYNMTVAEFKSFVRKIQKEK